MCSRSFTPGVAVTPHASGALLPHLMKRAFVSLFQMHGPPPCGWRPLFQDTCLLKLLRAILVRLATMSVTLVGAAVVVFFVIRVVPGNPIAMMLPPGASEEDIARLTALYGLDKIDLRAVLDLADRGLSR
jgi:hypothetical protein